MSNKPLNYKIEIKDIYKLAHFDSVDAVFEHVNSQLNTNLGDVTTDEVVEIFVNHAKEAYAIELKKRMTTKIEQDLEDFVISNT